MTLKRMITALAAALAAVTLLAGCTTTPDSTPTPPTTQTASPTPTATATTAPPPATEAEAIDAAEITLTTWLAVRGEVNAAGGTDTARLEAIATGRALEITLNDAASIATGPVLNEDGVNVDGPATTDGAIVHEPITGYGQEYQGVSNGLVTINACQDSSDYTITTNDGSPAMRPDRRRVVVDYQVVYDAQRQAWLAYDVIGLDQEC